MLTEEVNVFIGNKNNEWYENYKAQRGAVFIK
jgi:hypothetical protein